MRAKTNPRLAGIEVRHSGRQERRDGNEERPFYTPRELAKKLNLSERTIREMLRTKKIVSYKIEGSRRVHPEDLDSYLAERRDDDAAA